MNDIDLISRVTVNPGDRFVVRVPNRVPDVVMTRIGEYVASRLGVPVDHVLVLDDAMTLGAVSTLDQRREADLLDANNRAHERNVALSARLWAMQSALAHSAEGWRNAVELGLLPPQHVGSATILADQCTDALGNDPQAMTAVRLWRRLAMLHQIAANFSGMLEAVLAESGHQTSEANKDLRAAWIGQLDAIGQNALEEAPEGALAITLAPDPEDAQQPQDAAYKPTAMTEAGSIAAGGSALVKAFLHSGRGDVSPAEVDALHQFAAFAVDQLKARTLGADFQIVPPPQPSDTSVVTTVDFGKGGGMQGFRRTEQQPDGTVVDLTTMDD